MSYLVKAIRKLKPNSEFSFTNEDYLTIKWDILDGEAPTLVQINAAIEEVKADEAQAEIDKAAAKAAAEAKLESLGLTITDFRALGL